MKANLNKEPIELLAMMVKEKEIDNNDFLKIINSLALIKIQQSLERIERNIAASKGAFQEVQNKSLFERIFG